MPTDSKWNCLTALNTQAKPSDSDTKCYNMLREFITHSKYTDKKCSSSYDASAAESV